MPAVRSPLRFPRARRASRLALGMLAAFASATCDASGVLGPPRVENIVLTYTGDSSVVIGGRFAPQIDVRLDGAPMPEPRLRFLSSDTTIVAINARGDSLIARRIGSATVTAVLESSMLPKHPPAVTQRIDVTVGEILTDRPTLDLSSIGDTATLRVTVLDIDGLPIGGIPVSWSSSDTAIAVIDARGRVTARGNGAAILYGVVGIDTVTTALRVAQQVVKITFTPLSVRLDAIGATAVITALARDRNDSLVNGAAIEWAIDDPAIVGMDDAGTVTARRNGATWVRASVGLREDSIRVTVDQRAVLVVITATAGLEIQAVGEELQLVAVGFDRLSKDVTDGRPVWYSLDPTVAQVDSSGRVTGLSADTARIVASQDGAEDTVVVRVSNVPVSLEVFPSVAAISSVGDTLPLQVAVRNMNGIIVGTTVAWHTAEPAIVQVTSSGRVIGLAAGTARVIASASGLADTAVITVTNAPALLDIVPTSILLTFLGDTLSPATLIRNGRGDQLPRNTVTWTSDAPGVVIVSDSGRITAVGGGVTYVRATSNALRDSVRVTVNNDPQSIVLSLTQDTLTASGQQLPITSVVRNGAGFVLTGYATTWSTTNASVATVSSTGVVSAAGFGTTLIIGQAGAVADTAVVVVRNLTLINVDNSSTASPALGTSSRPFRRIGDALATATAFDTIFVRATGIPYSETVAIQSRVMLLGDSAAYLANGRDASRLPSISHDSGAAAIVITAGVPVSVRFMAIQHSIEGPAIDSRASDVRLEHVHINPGLGATVGSGILITDAPAFAIVAHSTVRAVRGYGVRIVNSAGARISDGDVRAVSAATGQSGAGIHLVRGSGGVIERTLVRLTAGPQIQADTASGLTIASNDLAGRWQLVRLTGLTGNSTVSGTSFNLTRQAGEPFTLGSEFDGRSGLEIRLSTHVAITGNTFFETQTDQMDAIRLIDARGTAMGGATILANVFNGGRHTVRSSNSTWAMTGARLTGAVVPIVMEGSDTVSLTNDTLEVATGATCVRATGSSAQLTVLRGVFRTCTVAGISVGGPAISFSGSGSTLIVTDSDLSGPDQTAIDFAARDLRVRGTRMLGYGNRTVSSFSASAALSADAAGALEVVGNVIGGYASSAGLLLADGDIRADSNRVMRTAAGMYVLNWRSLQMRGNDVSGSGWAGLHNDRGNRDLIAEGNWWGDSRGPRRLGTPAATGDSISGRVDFTPFAAAPHQPGTTAAELLEVRGDGQTGAAGSTLPQALTIRVVDADGRPVANVAVTFTVTSGGGLLAGATERVVVTDASGLAESTLSLTSAGTVAVRAVAAGVPAITLTATAQ